jgi:rhodanese-related sulfurtransferase
MVIVCADGERSAKLAARLREEGRDAASIDGGMEAWAKEGLPVQPRPDEEFEGPDYSKPPGGSG